MLDMEGRVVHTWPVDNNPHLLPTGSILDASTDDPSGFGGFKEVSWDGVTTWTYTESRSTYVNPPDAGYNTLMPLAVTDKAPKQISRQVVWNYSTASNLTVFSRKWLRDATERTNRQQPHLAKVSLRPGRHGTGRHFEDWL